MVEGGGSSAGAGRWRQRLCSVAWAREGWLKTFLKGTREGWNGLAERHLSEHRARQMEWRPLGVLPQEPEVGPG